MTDLKPSQFSWFVRGDHATRKPATDKPMVHLSTKKGGSRTAYISCWIQLEDEGDDNPFDVAINSGTIQNDHVRNLGPSDSGQLQGTIARLSYTPNSKEYFLWVFALEYKSVSGTGVLDLIVSSEFTGETDRGTVTTADDGVSDPDQ